MQQALKTPRKRLTRTESLAVIAELNRRANLKRLTVVDENFDRQSAFIRDPARKKAALCTRRAGKTEGVARGLVETCLKNDGVATLYIGLTKDSCRRIFWKAALKPLLKKHEGQITYKKNETRLEVEFGNGSAIYCLGMDADQEQMEKMLGGKYKLVVIDEAGSFRVDLEKMIEEILWPAMADLEGSVWLTGTPVDFTNSYFYKITRQDKVPRVSDWSVHEWSGADNPYMIKQWTRELADILQKRPRFMETPAFRRMWLGKWVIDASRLVYKYMRDRNWVPEHPGDARSYVYGLGIDLGWDDESTFVLSAYNQHSRKLYLLRPHKQGGMDISAVADKIKEYQARYDIYSMVIDGSNKQAVEEMRRRHGLPGLQAADKSGKAEFIDLFNSDLIHGDIVLVGVDTDIIEQEYANLIWDPSVEHRREEHPGCDNHLADAALYIWRKQRQYLYQPPVPKTAKTEEQQADEWMEKEARKQDDDVPFWERIV
jgi:hypothetical protein